MNKETTILTSVERSPTTLGRLAAIIAVTGIAAAPLAAQRAPIQVDQGVWGTVDDEGTMAWAIDQANTMPGPDIISIAPGLEIDVDAGPPLAAPLTSWLARFTESAEVQGNGARLVGNPAYVTSGGLAATKTNIVGSAYSPALEASDVLVVPSFNFAQIGTLGADNSLISVSFTDLSADGLATFVQANEGAQVTVIGGDFDNMVNYTRRNSGGRSVFEARSGSTLNLSHISITRNFPFGDVIDVPPDGSIFFGTISGEDSQLNLENSSINNSYGAGAISWNGGTANIVSSVINDSGGLSIADGTTEEGVLNFVNSILYMTGGDSLSQTNRIQALVGGEAHVLASSVLYDGLNTSTTGCNRGIAYGCNGMPLTATVGGVLNFESSVALTLNAGFVFPRKDSYSEFSFGDLVAGDYSYIAATQAQDSGAVTDLFGNLSIITEGLAYDLLETGVSEIPFLFNPLPDGAIPAADGALYRVIPDAGPSGANVLLNPIDGLPITIDVYGNPRVGASGHRDIGAVQLGLAPTLNLTATGDALVDLNWSRPLDHSSGAITGYEVCFGTGTVPNPSALGMNCEDGDGNPGVLDTIADLPETLTGQVTDLTNGDTYWFLVRGVNTESGGPWSNPVTATPTSSAGLDCSTAVPSLDTLWPANRELVSLDVEGLIDPAGGSIMISIDRIFQDEPVNGKGDGNTSPDAEIIGTSTANVRAERTGRGNGRVYTVYFTASNGDGAQCNGSVEVGVPRSLKRDAVNDGPWFNSGLN